MTNVFNNNFSGGTQNVAQGSSDVSQTINATTFAAGDATGFVEAVRVSGAVTETDADDLSRAIDEDRDDGNNPETPGPRLKGWLSRFGISTGSVAGKVAISGAGGILAGLAKQFLDIA
jgi:hypothetical protein